MTTSTVVVNRRRPAHLGDVAVLAVVVAPRTAESARAFRRELARLSSYSRNQEDQADRVGLRYVHEAGDDVRKGPGLWARFRDKYGDGNRVVNFFLGGHSRPTERIGNIERELVLNCR